MKAWYLSQNIEDIKLPNRDATKPDLTSEELYKLSGVEYFTFNTSSPSFEKELQQFMLKNAYKNHDLITISKEKMGSAYEQKLKIFYEKHIHEDSEIRLCLEGSGYFDILPPFSNSEWIRIEFLPNDLLILPAGIYHRFTVDQEDFIKVIRVFQEVPKWEAIGEEAAEKNQYRLAYLTSMAK